MLKIQNVLKNSLLLVTLLILSEAKPMDVQASQVQESNEFEIQSLEKNLPKSMIDALGGVKAIANFPILDASKIKIMQENDYNYSTVAYSDIAGWTAPIMRGIDKEGNMFIGIKFFKSDVEECEKSFPYFATLYRRDGEWRINCHKHSGNKLQDVGLGNAWNINYYNLKKLISNSEVTVTIRSCDEKADMTLKLFS